MAVEMVTEPDSLPVQMFWPYPRSGGEVAGKMSLSKNVRNHCGVPASISGLGRLENMVHKTIFQTGKSPIVAFLMLSVFGGTADHMPAAG